MKIILISKHFPPSIDGVGDHSYQIFKRLTEAGHECRVITASPSDIPGVHVHPLNGIGGLISLTRLIKSLQAEAIIFQYVGYSYGKYGLPIWLIPLFLTLKSQTILFVHETYERTQQSIKHRLLRVLQKSVLRYLCRSSTAVITSNALYVRQLRSFCKGIFMAPTPSNFEEAIHQPGQLVNECGQLAIVAFGNRDYTYSLQIVDKLSKYADVKFNILGLLPPDKTRNVLELIAEYDLEERVTMTGVVTAEELIKHLAKADLFLLPETVTAEGFGGLNSKSGTTATAFMLGLPVVSTSGDMTDPTLFIDDLNCILIPPADVSSAVEKIKSAILDSDERKLASLRDNSRRLYIEELSWANTIKIMRDICTT